jgi:integrase
VEEAGMSLKWVSTQYNGVRYREHVSRKHNGKPDRYFAIRYKIQGKLKEEALGWASEGWSAQKAFLQRSELRNAQTIGQGPQTLSEKRQIAQEKKEALSAEKRRTEKEALTFKQLFENSYFPDSAANKKRWSWKREEGLFTNWASPVIGNMRLADIRPFHVEIIKKNMLTQKKSARSINYAIALIRQVFNFARSNRLFTGDSPILGVKKLKEDNRRYRFLTEEEADKLSSQLMSSDMQLYGISLISLHCGLRAGEIFALKWGDINSSNRTIFIRDPKNKRNRTAYMTEKVMDYFSLIASGPADKLVFPNPKGCQYSQISPLFADTVKALGFNQEITDRRHKVVFHTLRHTYASWLVQRGVDLYTVKELMGHSTLAMTERYSHLRKENLTNAVKIFEEGLKKADTRPAETYRHSK